MDSLIRLDVLMPIAPLTENDAICPSTSDNFTNSQQIRFETDQSINLEETPEVIDLTNSQGDQLASPGETNTRPFHNSNPSVIPNNEVVEVLSGFMHRIPVKHKLPPLSNHSPPKVSRTAGNDFSSAMANPLFQSAGPSRPTISSHETGRPNSVSSIMKNHTITSADYNNDRSTQLGVLSNPAGTFSVSKAIGPCPYGQNYPENLPGQSLACNGSSNFIDNVSSQNFDLPTRSVPERNSHTRPSQLNITPTESDLGENKVGLKEPAMFYQLLDLFPDIDLQFLQNQCRLGLDINQVSEIILEMNDYPKDTYQNSVMLNARPKVVENSIVNSNITSSCSSSTVIPILVDEEIIAVDSQSGNDKFSQSAELDATSLTGPIPTTSIQDTTTNKISGNPKKDEKINEEVVVDKVISLLGREKNEVVNNDDKISSVQSKYSFLMEIFPDAEPAHLELKSKLNDNDLRNFIAESMEKRDYPKVKIPVKEEIDIRDESNEVGLYTTSFNIQNFIKIFPAPFEYFLDDKRNCQISEHGLGFLKRRYRYHSIRLISSKYREFNYNLVKTCVFLDEAKPSRASKRGLNELKMPEETNLPFLQEACFIEHKTEIKKYLDDLADAKRLSYDQAEANGELIECGCCYQNVLFEDCAACNEGHLFCKSCIQKSVEVRVGEAHTTFPCLLECDSIFSLKLLEELVDATMFSRLLQRIQLDEVRAADIEGLEVCPFCDFAVILPPETSIFKCLNPECLKESCRKCHKLSHIPQRCEEVESDDQARARKYIEDEMTKALVRDCYKCKKRFIKTDGCNKMTCTCGAKMCYICRKPIVDYNHFNGPGGENKQKCPLYSTEKILHVDAVEVVGKKALEEIQTKNPELKLKHDPTKILPPAESAKTILPPGVNEEAERLLNVLQNVRQVNAPPNDQLDQNIRPQQEALLAPFVGHIHQHRQYIRATLNAARIARQPVANNVAQDNQQQIRRVRITAQPGANYLVQVNQQQIRAAVVRIATQPGANNVVQHHQQQIRAAAAPIATRIRENHRHDHQNNRQNLDPITDQLTNIRQHLEDLLNPPDDLPHEL